jgi:2-polyprenyl-3-methyl-5-hydroxy-6-metoxy-1,4-benzoquinol methylase
MSLMTSLNFDKIELNANGPYNHGIWENPKTGSKIGKEEFLAGRSKYIFEKFCEFMQEFTEEQIMKMSIIDIGSYDGWFANEIERNFNFSKIVSSEPRLKNIAKGVAVRRYLNIDSRFEIKQENLEDIQGVFDIVVCIGVLHHVDSISRVIKKLSSVAQIGIFIETQIYEPIKFLENNYLGKVIQSKHNKRVIEPKDVVYINSKDNFPVVAVSGHKYESSYFDGSTSSSQVVELPSIDGLKLNLLANDFSVIKQHTTSRDYGKKLVNRDFRVYKATILSAIRTKQPGVNKFMDVKESIYTYERLQFVKFLREGTIRDLEVKQKLGLKREVAFRILSSIKKMPINVRYLVFLEKKICKLFNIDLEEISILTILKFDFKNKLQFEIAKFEILKGNYEKAKLLLIEVVESNDADWRSTYRSFFLLYLLSSIEGSENDKIYFLELLRKSNSEFPLELEPIVSDALGLQLRFKN